MNLDRASLTRRLNSAQSYVYCYIVKTVERSGGRLVQTGSGPNFQGGRITLCTCKWSMRAGRKNADSWKGMWIAGLTGAHVGGPDGNYLFFLMRVEHTFASHRDLWLWLSEHDPLAAEAKAADLHRLGDLYRPNDLDGNPYDPSTYIPPRRDHVHRRDDQWHKDIDYQAYDRRPTLLVGAPEDSYIWTGPCIRVPFSVGRGCRIVDLSALLA